MYITDLLMMIKRCVTYSEPCFGSWIVVSVPCLFCLSRLELELNLDIFIFREGVQCNWKYIEGTRYTGVNNTHVCDNTMTKTNSISTAYGIPEAKRFPYWSHYSKTPFICHIVITFRKWIIMPSFCNQPPVLDVIVLKTKLVY